MYIFYNDIAIIDLNNVLFVFIYKLYESVFMNILSHRQAKLLQRSYRQRYAIRPIIIDCSGRAKVVSDGISELAVVIRARTASLQQALCWGEPYVFFLAPAVMSWIIPLVNETSFLGGISGGEICIEDDRDQRSAAVNYLVESGLPRGQALQFVTKLPVWPQSKPREAAQYLFELSYQVTGFKPGLLVRNRANAIQQRQIAESIHERKQRTEHSYPMREEQMLLSLMRVGDRNGARRVLNETLAAIFLYSPNLVLIRARAIEMMGMLVRAAIEDNPLQESLMEEHQQWIAHIVQADSFEKLCEVLRYALDDFMNSIFTQSYNRGSYKVKLALDYIAENYTRAVSLDEVAAAAGLSRFHITRLVKRCTGKTISQHIRTLRINRACELLRQTGMPYTQIAYELGFTDQSYFIKQFRAMTGTTPRRYRGVS